MKVEELIKKYKEEVDKLELEIKIKPFETIKHKIAIRSTYKEVLKDLIKLSERQPTAEVSEKKESKALNIADVSNHVICDECGDTGRSYPTLQDPDGVICEKCSSK